MKKLLSFLCLIGLSSILGISIIACKDSTQKKQQKNNQSTTKNNKDDKEPKIKYNGSILPVINRKEIKVNINVPAPKYIYIESSIKNLKKYLSNHIFQSKDDVLLQLQKGNNLPGAHEDSLLKLGEVKEIKFVPVNSLNSDVELQYFFTFKAKLALKDSTISNWQTDLPNDFVEYKGLYWA